MNDTEFKPESDVKVEANFKNPESTNQTQVEILPPILKEKERSLSHIRDEQLALQIRDLGRLGLSKGNAGIAARISSYIMDKYYLEDYLQGVSEMQKGLASVAIQEAMDGNTPILLHLLKTKLGWSEQQVIEHVGEIRAVVSNKPLSKDEFVQKYLTKDE